MLLTSGSAMPGGGCVTHLYFRTGCSFLLLLYALPGMHSRKKKFMKPALFVRGLSVKHVRSVLFGVCALLLLACQEKKPVAVTPPPEPVVPEVKETKTGLASFYGRAFDGQKTASGEI